MRLILALMGVLSLVGVAGAQLGPLGAPTPLASFTPIQVLPMGTRAAGTYNFGPVTVPTGVQAATALMDVSEATEPLPTITAILEGSLDGGTTWQSIGSYSKSSGPKGQLPPALGGGTRTQIGASFDGGTFWTATANANRRLRGVATITTSMRFALTVTPL